MNGERKQGRPRGEEKREPLVMINFKADPEVMAALDELEDALGSGHVRARSIAIRKAILEARDRLHLPGGSKKSKTK